MRQHKVQALANSAFCLDAPVTLTEMLIGAQGAEANSTSKESFRRSMVSGERACNMLVISS